MRARRWFTAAAAILLLGGGCAQGGDEAAQGSPSPAAEEGVIEVRAGVNDKDDPTIAVTEFLPEDVTVASGTTVKWTVAGPEPHSVTFLPSDQTPPPPDQAEKYFEPQPATGPYDGTSVANSGLGPQGRDPLTFELAFSKEGSYDYFCVIHPLMTGTVEVVAEGEEADSQAEVTQRGDEELEKWLEEGRKAKKELIESDVRKETAGGTTTWWVEMGITTEHTDILAFSPALAEIKAGDKVVFVNNSQAPHTATFKGNGEFPEDITGPEAQAPQPGPSPQKLTEGTYLSTGWLPPNAPPGGGPPEQARSYTYEVPAAGTFDYVCLLHVPSGMVGKIQAA